MAGVTNPRFEDLHAWDVLCNIENGKVIVAKDIAPAPPLQPRPAMTRDTFSSNSLTSQAGSAGIGHDASRAPSEVETGTKAVAGGGRERSGTMIETRQDAPDNMFMEDVSPFLRSLPEGISSSCTHADSCACTDPRRHQCALWRKVHSRSVHRLRTALCAYCRASRGAFLRFHSHWCAFTALPQWPAG